MANSSYEEKLNIDVNGIPETVYRVYDDSVELSQRQNPTTVGFVQYGDILKLITDWVLNWHPVLKRPRSPLASFLEEFKKSSGKLESKFKIGSNTIVDMEYKKVDNELTFKPKQGVTLNNSEFLAFVDHLERIRTEIQNF